MQRKQNKMTHLCPYTQICPIYKNWTEQTKNRRVDVIITNENKMHRYDCLALMAAFDQPTEGGIPMSNELRGQLSNPDDKHGIDCSHLSLLNSLSDLTDLIFN